MALLECCKGLRSLLKDLGFGEDAVAIALDRTITNIGTMKLSHMNSILQNWHEKGSMTPGRVRRRTAPAVPPRGSKGRTRARPST